MNSNERFEDLASRLLDDALDEAERRELGELLVSDGLARRELLLLAAIHQELASSGRALVVRAARVRRVRGRTLRWTAHVGWAAAVAAILVGLSLLSIKPEVSRPEVEAPLPAVSQKQLVPEPQPIASEKLASAQVPTGDAARQPMEPPASGDKEPVEVEAPVASQAELASLEMPSEGSGQSLPGGHVAYLDALEGDVELARGNSGAWAQAVAGAPISSGDRLRTKISRARVVFESGSVLYVNHWTTLTISVVGMALTPLVSMAGGELYVEVVPQDRGFTVETPHGRAVDLGTRFAVEARPAGTTVSVLDGRVRASTDAGSAELMANQEVFLARKESLPGRVRVVRGLEGRLGWRSFTRPSVAGASWTANLALGRPAGASSVYESFIDYSAGNGNDGSLETIWASADRDRLPWWQVDLGVPRRISRVEIVARQEQEVDYPEARTGIEIRGSNWPDGRDYVVLASYKGKPFEHRGTWVAFVNDPGAFRYIRVVHVNRKHFNFAEFRVFGEPVR